MSLETGTYIDDLVVTNPTSTDLVKFGDDHLRLLKTCIKNTFPNVDGAVNPTPAEFNYLVGVTSLLQTQLDAKLAIATADGAGLIEAGGVLAVGAGAGILVNTDDVALGNLGDLAAIEANAIAPAADGYLVDDAGTPKRMAHTDAGLTIVEETGTSRVLATVDMNTHIDANNAAAIAITLNTGVGKNGNWVEVEQKGAGQVTVGGTATVNSPNGLKTYGQYSTIRLLCKGSNIWTLSGDSAP